MFDMELKLLVLYTFLYYYLPNYLLISPVSKHVIQIFIKSYNLVLETRITLDIRSSICNSVPSVSHTL